MSELTDEPSENFAPLYMSPTLLLKLPPKFIGILEEAVSYRINSMQRLLDDPNTTDEELAEIDYANDQSILKTINDDIKNINNQITADFYQLSQTKDATQTTLQLFGKPIDEEEQLIFVFSAKSYNDAMAIKNRFLGFPMYKPMSDD